MSPPKKNKKTPLNASTKKTPQSKAPVKKTIKKKTTPKKTSTARKSTSSAAPKKVAAQKKTQKKVTAKKTTTRSAAKKSSAQAQKKSQPAQKKAQPITVHIAPSATPLWKRVMALFFLALFAAISGTLLYFSNPVFQNNVDGIARSLDQWTQRLTASIYDLRLLSANTLSLPGPDETAGNTYTIISCDRCNPAPLASLLQADASVKTIDYTSSDAQKILVEHGIKYVPALIEDKEGGSVVKYAEPNFYLKQPSIQGSYFKGSSDTAPVKIFAYLDFTDPVSAQAAADLDKLVRENSSVRMYFKPVTRTERQQVLVKTFECAADQNRAWPMHNWIFNEIQNEYSFDSMLETAKDFVHIDSEAFVNCMKSDSVQEKIATMTNELDDFHIAQTPTLIVNGTVLSGSAYSIDALHTILENLQKKPSVTPESMSWGSKDAHVTLVEYCDFESPFCAEYFSDIYPEIQSHFADTVRYVKRDFPLSPIHKNAVAAAQAARCAGEQDAYSTMSATLYAKRNLWVDVDAPQTVFTQFASDLSLDEDSFSSCLDNDQIAQSIRDDFEHAVSIGVDAVPTMILYRADGSSRFIEGLLSYKDFERLINQELSQ